jgi:hypothetical protein
MTCGRERERGTHPLYHVVKQLLGIPLAAGTGLRAQVQQVPRFVVTIAENRGLGVVEHIDQVVVSLVALERKLELEAPEAAAEACPPAV